MPTPEQIFARITKDNEEDEAIFRSMEPGKAEIFIKFTDELIARQATFPGFGNLTPQDKEVWMESIEQELFESIPGSKEAQEEFMAQAELLGAKTKGRIL